MADESEQPTQLIQGPPVPPRGGTATLEPHEPRLADGGGVGAPPNYPPTGYGGDGDGTGGDGFDEEPPSDKRVAILAAIAGILVVVVLFLVLRPSDDAEPAVESTPIATTQPAPAQPSTPAATTTTPAASTPTTDDEASDGDDASGGDAIGDPAADLPQLGGAEVVKFEAAQGDAVRFQVTNDGEQTQEVHVHGYDRSYDVEPGETRTISFPATLTGRFEIEFEATATQIGELTVTP